MYLLIVVSASIEADQTGRRKEKKLPQQHDGSGGAQEGGREFNSISRMLAKKYGKLIDFFLPSFLPFFPPSVCLMSRSDKWVIWTHVSD